jgi:hypothetical protein
LVGGEGDSLHASRAARSRPRRKSFVWLAGSEFDMSCVMGDSKATATTVPVSTKAAASMPACDIAELLQEVPLHSSRRVLMLFTQPEFGNLAFPEEIRVHCDHQNCEGIRRHSNYKEARFPLNDAISYHQVAYACSNCRTCVSVFSLKAERQGKNEYSGVCTKIYQEPPFGSPIPKRLFHIIGEANREYFKRGGRLLVGLE